MLKKVKVEQLKPGVFIQSFDCGWMAHPFLFNHKLVSNEKTIRTIIDWGIREVYIDTEKGLDIVDAPTIVEYRRKVEHKIKDMVKDIPDEVCQVPVEEEIIHAQEVKKETTRVVENIMDDAREGKDVKPEEALQIVEKIDDSISRNKDALVLLMRIRSKDNYTFHHSVGVGAMMMSFCKYLNLGHTRMIDIGMGAILHDIGKMRVPVQILNKPGELTEIEFEEIKKHVIHCHDILVKMKRIPEDAICVAMHHHERHDGTGYCEGLKGDDICLGGRMAAIVDVYDAITSNRCYHDAMDPVEGLRKIYDWGKYHFDKKLAHQFIKLMGIYPIGTVVELESGLVGVVTASTGNLLKPVVSAVYNKKKGWPISPRVIDLSRPQGQVRIPDDPDHPFHLIPATDSISSRPVIPGHSGH